MREGQGSGKSHRQTHVLPLIDVLASQQEPQDPVLILFLSSPSCAESSIDGKGQKLAADSICDVEAGTALYGIPGPQFFMTPSQMALSKGMEVSKWAFSGSFSFRTLMIRCA